MNRCALNALWGVAVVVLFMSSVVNGQGVSREDRIEVAKMEAFVGEAPIGTRPEFVDLRPYLPPVGRQTMNDCAAWAFGYAARSYLEAVDQGWKPDSPNRIFSPTFIYNQVNGGEDKGSSPVNVIKLLKESGAATLSTAPYRAKDYTYQPNELARQEAKVFPLAGAYVLRDGEAIRKALAAGEIVCVGVRTNPVFNSGRFDLYSSQLHEQARQARKPGQPHGFHAMVVCGYSEPRRAFLFMNSWGKEWGQGGFIWVSYDVVDTFNTRENTERLVDCAIVMVDEREPVVFQGGKYQVVDGRDLELRVSGRFSGTSEKGTPRFDFQAKLVGPGATVQGIKSVDWAFNSGGMDMTVPAERGQPPRTVLKSLTHDAKLRIVAKVAYAGDRRHELVKELDLSTAMLREISLGSAEQFNRVTPNGQKHWYACYFPRMGDQDWAALQKIEWRVDGKVRTYMHPPGELMPAFSSRSQAYYIAEDQADPPKGSAVLTFQDGFEWSLDLPGVFTAPELDRATVSTLIRPIGSGDGREWWYYEIQYNVPRRWALNMRSARTRIGDINDGDWSQMKRDDRQGIISWVQGGFTDKPLIVECDAVFNPSFPNGRNLPAMVSGVRVLPREEMVREDKRGYSIEVKDRYLGRIAGVDQWEYHAVVWQVLGGSNFNKVTWTLPDGETRVVDSWLVGRFGTRIDRSAEPFELRAAVESWDPDGTARTIELKRMIQPTTPANDALTVAASARLSADLLTEDLSDHYVELTPIGPRDAVKSIRRIVANTETPWGTLDRVGTPKEAIAVDGDALSMRVVYCDRGKPIEGYLELNDGSRLPFSVWPQPGEPTLLPPRLRLESVERYAGTVDGKPTWTAALRVAGDQGLIEAIEHVDFAAIGIDGSAIPIAKDRDERRASVRSHQPARLKAMVHFKAESDFETMEIESRIDAIDRLDNLVLHVAKPWTQYEDPNYNLDIGDMEFDEPAVAWITGGDLDLEAIESVEYATSSDFDGERRFPVNQRRVDGLDGFPLRFRISVESPTAVVATLRLKDGETREIRSVESSEATPLARTVRYWGRDEGKPLWMMSYRIEEALPRPTLRVRYESADGTKDDIVTSELGRMSFAAPAFAWHALVSTPLELHRIHADMLPWAGTAELEPMPIRMDLPDMLWPKREDTVRVDLTTDPENPSIHFIHLRGPESIIGRCTDVRYEIEREDARTTLHPLSRFGEMGDAWDARIVGKAPSGIRAIFHMAGSSEPTTIVWRRR